MAFHGNNAIEAWLTLNGIGTISINDSYRISSVSDEGTGKYFVNFSDSFANAKYAAEDKLLLLEREQILQQAKLEFLVLTLMVLLTQETVDKFV